MVDKGHWPRHPTLIHFRKETFHKKTHKEHWHAFVGRLAHRLGSGYTRPGAKWPGPGSGGSRHCRRNFHFLGPLGHLTRLFPIDHIKKKTHVNYHCHHHPVEFLWGGENFPQLFRASVSAARIMPSENGFLFDSLLPGASVKDVRKGDPL